MMGLIQSSSGPELRTDLAPPARDGEAVIRLEHAGICATDLEIARGYMGFAGVMGHEFVGVVERAPDPVWLGRRVVGEINCPCGRCPTCRAGRPTHCPNRTVLGIVGRDGAFAERFNLPLANLHPVPPEVPAAAAAFVEPLAAACAIVDQVHVHPTDIAVVVGVGRLGQLVARVLALTGCQVHAISTNPAHLALLPPTIEPIAPTEAGRVAGADLVVDCTGHPDGLALATTLVRPRGTIVLKTTLHEGHAPDPTPWVVDEVTLVGSRCGPFAPALRLLAAGVVDPRPLITGRYALADAVAALDAAARPEHVKVLLTP